MSPPRRSTKSRRDAQVRAAALETARDRERRADRRADFVQRPAGPRDRFDDPLAIDHAKAIERSEIGAYGFGDARAEPGDFSILSEIDEVEDGKGRAIQIDCGSRIVRVIRLRESIVDRRCGRDIAGRDFRNETVTAPRDRPNKRR
jgi:hypothetical protein